MNRPIWVFVILLLTGCKSQGDSPFVAADMFNAFATGFSEGVKNQPVVHQHSHTHTVTGNIQHEIVAPVYPLQSRITSLPVSSF